MKFTAGLLVAATLASAAPIRVIVVAKPFSRDVTFEDALQNMRFGHAAQPTAVRMPDFFPAMPTAVPAHGKHTGCGGSLKSKMNAMTNAWRKIMGLASIEEFQHPDILPPGHPLTHEGKSVHIMPFYPVIEGHPNRYPAPTAVRGPIIQNFDARRIRHSSFLHRLHRAMNILTPWEGRAVSFVVGCGLGVLLRMLYVLALVFVRSIRAKKTPVVLETNAEDESPLYVAPPQYIVIVDEKQEVAIAPIET